MIAKRILYSLAVLALVSILGFLLLHEREQVKPRPHSYSTKTKQFSPQKPRVKLPDSPIAKNPEEKPLNRPKTIGTGIHGRVTDEATGQPITNAKLTIKDVSHVSTDLLGRFSIPAPLQKQQWAIVVRAKGYHPKLFEALSTRGLQKIHNVQLKKAKVGRLEGEVEYLGKKPEGYTVFIDREKYHFPISQTHFVIEDIIVGQHLVGVSGVDDARKFPFYNVSVYIREEEPAQIKFTIPAQATFAGRVVDEQGRGLKDAYINIAQISVRSEEEGKFRSTIIPAALHKIVKVSHHEFGWSEFGPFDFRYGGGRDDIEFVLRPKGNGLVSGKITNLIMSGQERGLAQLYKKVLPKEGKPGSINILRSFTIFERPLGYQFPNLLPGTYIIRIIGPRQQLQREFELTENQQLQLDLKIPDIPKKEPK